MNPTRRNKQFDLNEERINDWHQAGPGVTQFLNSLSLFFPEGERYFIRSVRAFKSVTPQWLQNNVSNFIGQEAFHGREHEVLNKMMNSDKFDKFLEKSLNVLSDTLPDDVNLATTIALEHVTAILAQGLLEDVEDFVDSDPAFRDLWIWHALEETEHKAVAFDVYKYAVPGSEIRKYVIRSFALLISTVILALALSERYVRVMNRNKQLTVDNVKYALRFMFIRPGVITKCVPRWLDWFKPGFHPWQHDNSAELTKYHEFLAK